MGLDKESSLDLEVAVKDAIYEGTTDDHVLASTLALTIREIKTGRPLFENPLDEPILYSRQIRPWVRQAIVSLRKANEKKEDDDTIW